MDDQIKGPLDIWPFPVINAIIKIVKIRNEQNFPPVEVERNDQGEVTEVNIKHE